VPQRKPVGSPEVLATPDGAAIAGWEQLTIELPAGATGLRHVMVVLDADGQPISAGDTVLYRAEVRTPEGATRVECRQESLGGRLEPDGTFRGTRWQAVGVETDDAEPPLEMTRSEPTVAEVLALKALVADVVSRARFHVTSPDGRHAARLAVAGEIRFGPVYYRLAIDGIALADRIFGDNLRWSDDSRLLAAQEWRTTDDPTGPVTRVALFDVERRRWAALPDVRRGFAEHFVFAGPVFRYRARRYAAGTADEMTVTLASIEEWRGY
jgi:hypothetical protein